MKQGEEMKHTAGPWSVEPIDHLNDADKEGDWCAYVTPALAEGGYRGDICYIQSGRYISSEEAQANAALIASAPSLQSHNVALVKALEGLLEADVYADSEGLVTIGRADGGTAVEAVAIARAALALSARVNERKGV